MAGKDPKVNKILFLILFYSKRGNQLSLKNIKVQSVSIIPHWSMHFLYTLNSLITKCIGKLDLKKKLNNNFGSNGYSTKQNGLPGKNNKGLKD